MNFAQIIILASALGIDALIGLFALSTCAADKRRIFFLTSLSIGLFHFGMPIIGRLLSSIVLNNFSNFAPYLSSGIFLFLAVNMILSAYKKDTPKANFTFWGIIFLSYIFSIDSLAAGFSISLITDYSIYITAAIFAIFSFAMAYIGSILGRRCASWNTKVSYIIGGIFMVILAIRSLL